MSEEGGWSPRFSRPFNDWEVEEVERFLLAIQGKRWLLMWRIGALEETKDGKFLLSPFIVLLNLEVQFRFQRASFGALCSLKSRCFLCCDEEESINYILIHCTKAKLLYASLPENLGELKA
ncbi:hypothetical protein CK203_056320 [Vitis vinifera]|uniref:Reverse transcriptase zinc-binding domain-containing protein n=1 Tax=Vitis vinifera TaxID=29760 RepID=A0A438GNZ3_VITVI|nr:hypothetical protein CK203_056320 [Vitis vinifera]